MHHYQKKNIFSKIFFNQITLTIISIAIIIAIGFPLLENNKKKNQINSELQELQDQVNKIENEDLELNQMIEYFTSNEFIDEQARLKMNYKKKGEELVVIKTTNKLQKTDFEKQILKNRSQNIEETNLKKWWKYFFKN